MNCLFAHWELFWLRLHWHNLICDQLEWDYCASHITMTEVYSNNLFPGMVLEEA